MRKLEATIIIAMLIVANAGTMVLLGSILFEVLPQ